MPKFTNLPEQITSSEDYKNLVDLFAVLAEANDQKNELQIELNRESRELVDEHRAKIVKLETTIADAEASIEIIAKRHPEWFRKVKTLKVPYGECAFRRVSELIAPSEDLAISRIKAAGRAKDFIRTEESLDLEALEKLSDEELSRFGITRRTEDKFRAKPAKVDLGKAAAGTAEEASQAA